MKSKMFFCYTFSTYCQILWMSSRISQRIRILSVQKCLLLFLVTFIELETSWIFIRVENILQQFFTGEIKNVKKCSPRAQWKLRNEKFLLMNGKRRFVSIFVYKFIFVCSDNWIRKYTLHGWMTATWNEHTNVHVYILHFVVASARANACWFLIFWLRANMPRASHVCI